ncbi:tetratricopeptide (TPR) repeat protein [Allocatelliglobosispora scoriae]|uniref:Tetratricopeptide (TPR) repeat protein n=1 Tax=Allocatelliglobosispora scoriae TaxID=643052 RepID=A0A841BLE5_9ACTN|nr:hypothetical protein [Allocatelliglobosispora scoriae]MBB5868455.1 tetratricopeptide (TPR) repeat protein [Allocatelliglobosispora scoriae]
MGPTPWRESVRLEPGGLLRGGTQALWTDGDLALSRDHFDAAYRAAEATGDGEALALAAAGLGGLWVHEHRGVQVATLTRDRLRRAVAATEPASPLGIRLRARLAAEHEYSIGEHAATLALVDEARRCGDQIAIFDTASLAFHCALGPGLGELRRSLSDEIISAAIANGCRSDLLMGLLWRVVGLLLDGDALADRALTELRAELADRDHLAVAFVVQAIEVMLRIRAGRFAEARSLAADCADLGRSAGDVDALGWHGAQLVAIAWFEGRLTDLLPMLRELAASPTLSASDYSYVAALAVACAQAGQRREAMSALAKLHGPGLATLPRSSSWLVMIYGLIEAAALLADGELATEAYNLLLPHADQPMLASMGVACFGSAQHALGVASLAAGETDRAVTHLRAAVRDNLKLGHFPAAAMSRARLAQALRQRSGADDRAEADRQLGIATSDAAELGVALPAAPAPPPARGVRRRQPVACRRRGRDWEFSLGHRVAVVDDSVGTRYLAALVANPGYEIAAVELAVGPDPASSIAAATTTGQPVLDEAAKRSYRRRLTELTDEVEEAEARHDPARAERARSERQWLIDELAARTGLGGRDRTFAGNTERARISVGKAIRRALAHIATADPVIGEELRTAVRTGVRCCYQPL